MKKVLIFLIVISFTFIGISHSDMTPPWTSSFNTGGQCGEATYTGSANVATVNCDGWSMYGDWQCEGAGNTEITTAANYSGGAGGRGVRQRYGDNNGNPNATATNSTEPSIRFTTPVTNVWIRWYMRLESGMEMDRLNYWKLFYIYSSSAVGRYIDSGSSYNILRVGNTDSQFSSYWMDDIYGTTSDGSWHSYEVNFDIAGSTASLWVDGVLRGSSTVTWGITNISYIRFSENAKNAYSNNQCYTIDKDDVALSTTGYIGPLTGANPIVSVEATDAVATEQGETSAIYTLTRDQTSGALAVTYTMSGTATGGGTDYGTLSGTANFTDGNATTTVTLTAVDDAAIEGDETAIMTLTDGASYDLGTPTATVIITDNDQTPPPPVTLIEEDFESGTAGLVSHGWYDNTSGQDLVYDAGADARDGSDSGMVAKYNFVQSATTPDSGGAMRVQFSETPVLYVTFWIKYSTNWVGNGSGTYGHHIAYALTNASTAWSGLANSYLTAYFEMEYNNILNTAFQDALNVDQNQIGVDLTGTFNSGASHGCNGNFTNAGTGVTCYDIGGGYHLNQRWWEQSTSNLADGNWHQLRYVIDMNTITGSTVNQNGTLSMYADNMVTPIFTATNVVFKKGIFSNQFFNQFILGPYLSAGSPLVADQTMYIDDLIVGTNDGDVVPPAIDSQSPAKQATGVAVNTNISSVISDGGNGVDIATIVMYEEGNKHCCSGETCVGGTADLTCSGTSASYTVTLNPSDYSNSQQVDVTWDASDLTTGNPMPTDSYYFTTAVATPAPPGTASGNGAGVAAGNGAGTITGTAP